MASHSPNSAARYRRLTATLVRALPTCSTEADVLQLLYAELRPVFGYDPIALQVLDREGGWCHAFAIDHGLLQDVRRRPVSESIFASSYSRTETVVSYPRPEKSRTPSAARGPGRQRAPQTVIWVPIQLDRRVIGAVTYQLYTHRRVPDWERRLLEEVHAHMGVVVNSAYLNELTRNQAISLGALNTVARALSGTRDEGGVVLTLRDALGRLLPIDELELTVLDPDATGRCRLLKVAHGGITEDRLPTASAQLEDVQKVLAAGEPHLSAPDREHEARRSLAWVPVKEGGAVTAVLSVRTNQAQAYEQSTLSFLQQVADQVGLALRNAWSYASVQQQAQRLELANVALRAERRRLEMLHVLETGTAGAASERQVTEALFRALRGSLDASGLLLVYLDARGQLTGYVVRDRGALSPLAPKPVEKTAYFRRLAGDPRTIVEPTSPELQPALTSSGWSLNDPERWPAHVMWVPLQQGERVVGALSAQRFEDRPFSKEEVELVESAAPAVAMALRTVRLHRANEQALRHSVRIQELSALAGHDTSSVVGSIAEQARSMFGAVGASCWAFDEEGRVAAQAGAGDASAGRMLKWAEAQFPSHRPVTGARAKLLWSLMPLHYGRRLVGALGLLLTPTAFDELLEAPEDFIRTAAVAIENARLAAETWGRIRTLEAVAAFADLDIRWPDRARAEMGSLAERALADAGGTLWLVEGQEIVRTAWGRPAERLPVPRGQTPRQVRGLAAAVRRRVAGEGGARLDQVLADPVYVEGEFAGMLTAIAVDHPAAEVGRLLSVLSSQLGLVLGRLRLVAALDGQAETMDAILRHSPVGVVLENSEGRAVYVNPAIERIYGVTASRVIGQPLQGLFGQVRAEVVTPADAPPDGPIELRLGPEGRKVVEVRHVSIPSSQERRGGSLTLHEDVTEERTILDAKDLMLRAVAHEVRSPAAAMRATVASLLQWDQMMEPVQRRGLLEDAYEQSERLLNLVEAQLIIAKLEAGGFQPNQLPVSIRETAGQVERVLRNRYGARVEAVEFDLPAGVPDVLCEPTHLEQALTNLIGNALEHAWATRIVVRARRLDDNWVEVGIKDNGRGLPAERVRMLFSRSPAGKSRAHAGLGLGLYLCRLIIERSFGGRVWLEKTGPRGSTFKFTVPAIGTTPPEARRGHVRVEEPRD